MSVRNSLKGYCHYKDESNFDDQKEVNKKKLQMAPESFLIVHLGFLNFPTLNILWNFPCEVLP